MNRSPRDRDVVLEFLEGQIAERLEELKTMREWGEARRRGCPRCGLSWPEPNILHSWEQDAEDSPGFRAAVEHITDCDPGAVLPNLVDGVG